MRFILLLPFFFLAGLRPACAADSPADSLRSVLARTIAPAKRIQIYRNLADATSETPVSCNYLFQLIEISRAAGQTRQMMEALTDLTVNYILREETDSARYAISLTEKYAPADQHDQWLCYLRMRMFCSDLTGENLGQAIDEKIAEFKNRDIAKESLYRQIEIDFTLGMALDNKDENADAISYLDQALELAKKLPFREGCPYQLFIMRQLGRIYNQTMKTQQASEFIKSNIELKKKYYELYDKATRPFYPMDSFYITNYSSLLINILNMPDEEVKYYLDRLVELSDKSNNPADKYSCFLAQFNYNTVHDNLHQALIYNDSLIYYARKIAVYSLPNLYRINSILYEELGDDKKALQNQREYTRLQDSIRMADSEIKYDKLRVEYDVNRLNFEKSQLEIRNKHIMLITLSVILLLFIGLCYYLYWHLKQEQQRKEHMQQLKMRAEESEKLKTVFINSICHEIRTPLNGIVGFAELLLDPSLEEEERNTFPEEIQRNTRQLVTLINSMLEVANLDVSDEKLPCEATDLHLLCHNVFEKFTEENNGAIAGIIRLPDEPLTIQTHKRYLAVVIENLLANAYKFTKEGSVTLQCERREDGIVISITDTGSGIPVEKHQVVFDRFTKLDTHTQGSGLGLYLCKLVIHRLSGSIYIDPDYTEGTRVIVVLPFI